MYRLAGFVFIGTFLFGPTVFAESNPGCWEDSDCGAGRVCSGMLGGNCVPNTVVCDLSGDCSLGEYCTHHVNTCSPAGERCGSGERNGECATVPNNSCTADADCSTEELCWATVVKDCLVGDVECERAGVGTCVSTGTFCSGTAMSTCGTGKTCVNERCVATMLASDAADIDIDSDKQERLRALWQPPTPSNGCASVGSFSLLFGVGCLWFVMLGVKRG